MVISKECIVWTKSIITMRQKIRGNKLLFLLHEQLFPLPNVVTFLYCGDIQEKYFSKIFPKQKKQSKLNAHVKTFGRKFKGVFPLWALWPSLMSTSQLHQFLVAQMVRQLQPKTQHLSSNHMQKWPLSLLSWYKLGTRFSSGEAGDNFGCTGLWVHI